MQAQATTRKVRGVLKNAGAGLLLFLWLLTTAMAVSPVLHRLIHVDADGADHQCAVTALHQGKFHSDVPIVTSRVPVSPVFAAPASFVSVLRSTIPYLLVPGRAPPAAILPLV